MAGGIGSATRIHALDALRGLMMLLGVLLHILCAYNRQINDWWYQDRHVSAWLDVPLIVLHDFRLPAFFLLAGFFVRLQSQRRGWAWVATNRILRLGLPFLAGVFLLTPTLKVLGAYAWGVAHHPQPFVNTLRYIRDGGILSTFHPIHLWFLEYLLILILAMTPLLRIADRRPAFRSLSAWLTDYRRSPAGMVLLMAVFMALLLPMRLGNLDTPSRFLPRLHILAAYSLFYALGWMLHLNLGLLLSELRPPRWLSPAFLISSAMHVLIIFRMEDSGTDSLSWRLVSSFVGSIASISGVFGSIDLALRLWNRESWFIRQISDSAYWIYLIHPVVLIPVHAVFAKAAIPGPWKALLVFLIAAPALFATYWWFARNNWVSKFLSGQWVALDRLSSISPRPADIASNAASSA